VAVPIPFFLLLLRPTMGSEMVDNKLGTPSLPAFYQSSAPRKSGRLYLVFCVLASLFLVNVYPSFQCHSRAESDEQVFWHPPEHPGAYPTSNISVPGRTDDVQFDHYSLILKGHRVFLQYVGTSTRVTSQNIHIAIALENFTPGAFQFHLYGPTSSKRRKPPD
jgi:hypothetical protein